MDGTCRYIDENFRKLLQSNKVPWKLSITEYMIKVCPSLVPFAPYHTSQPARKQSECPSTTTMVQNVNAHNVILGKSAKYAANRIPKLNVANQIEANLTAN